MFANFIKKIIAPLRDMSSSKRIAMRFDELMERHKRLMIPQDVDEVDVLGDHEAFMTLMSHKTSTKSTSCAT